MANKQPNKKLEPKKPKFSAYWIYAAIIIIFLGINFFGAGGSNEAAKTNPAEFQSFLRDGDVLKLVMVTKDQAKVFLTVDAKSKDIPKKAAGDEWFAGGETPAYSC